jgi:hypothetical protein
MALASQTVRIDDVTAILREAAKLAILPRFRALTKEKVPGEIVAVADREAGEMITCRWRSRACHDFRVSHG